MVSENDRKTIHEISVATTEFEFDFYIEAEADLKVYYTDTDGQNTLLTKDSNYTVTDSDADDYADGGTVTIIDPAAGYDEGTLTIIGETEKSQEVDFVEYQATPKTVYEASLDKLTMMVQELGEQVSRALLFPLAELGSEEEIPLADARANNTLTFDEDGKPIAASVTDATVSSFAQTVVNKADAAAMLTQLGFSSFFQTLLSSATAALVRNELEAISGQIILDLYGVSNHALISGGAVSQGTGDTLDISAAKAVIKTSSGSVYTVAVSAETDLVIGDAVLDGSTTNYVKIQASGHDDYAIVVDNSAPGAYDLELDRFVGSTGGTFTIFSNIASEAKNSQTILSCIVNVLDLSIGVTERDTAWQTGSYIWVLDDTNNKLDIFDVNMEDGSTSSYYWTAASINVDTYDRLERMDDVTVAMVNTTDNELQVYELSGGAISKTGSALITLSRPKICSALNGRDIFVTDLSGGGAVLSLYRWDGSSLSEVASVANTSTDTTPVAALSPTHVVTHHNDNETIIMWELNGSSFTELGSISVGGAFTGVVLGRLSDTDVWMIKGSSNIAAQYHFDFDTNTWECLADNLPTATAVFEANNLGNGNVYISRGYMYQVITAPAEAGVVE